VKIHSGECPRHPTVRTSVPRGTEPVCLQGRRCRPRRPRVEADVVAVAGGGDEDGLVAVPSLKKHPGWYYNVLANTSVTIEVGTSTMEVEAREAVGSERARIWARQKALPSGVRRVRDADLATNSGAPARAARTSGRVEALRARAESRYGGPRREPVGLVGLRRRVGRVEVRGRGLGGVAVTLPLRSR
jgi:deazaflavin-dependent oxidoreductase (nitroreductase family)